MFHFSSCQCKIVQVYTVDLRSLHFSLDNLTAYLRYTVSQFYTWTSSVVHSHVSQAMHAPSVITREALHQRLGHAMKPYNTSVCSVLVACMQTRGSFSHRRGFVRLHAMCVCVSHAFHRRRKQSINIYNFPHRMHMICTWTLLVYG